MAAKKTAKKTIKKDDELEEKEVLAEEAETEEVSVPKIKKEGAEEEEEGEFDPKKVVSDAGEDLQDAYYGADDIEVDDLEEVAGDDDDILSEFSENNW